jgi:hypothetical protein
MTPPKHPPRLRSTAFAALACLALLSFAGCGPSQPTGIVYDTVPAAGRITYQGKPLENYRVYLHPADATQRVSSGKTDADGRFTLGTNEEGDGALVGAHKVSVTYVGPEIQEEPGRETFAPPPPPSVEVPEKYTQADTSNVTVTIPEGGDKNLVINLK